MAQPKNFRFDLYNTDGLSYIEFTHNGRDQVIGFDNKSTACDLLRCLYLKLDDIIDDDDQLGIALIHYLRKHMVFKLDPNSVFHDYYTPKWRKPESSNNVYIYHEGTACIAQIESANVFAISNGTTHSK